MGHHLKWNSYYPVETIKVGGDQTPKAFHVLRCMSTPKCNEELRLSVGSIKRLPPHAIIKQAHQRGWHADRRGYCLCPNHTPWAKRNGQPSNMPPDQKRAAYCAIRDRDMALAANDAGPDPIIMEKNMELETLQRDAVLDRAATDPRVTPRELDAFKALVAGIRKGDFSSGWRQRVAESIGMHPNHLSDNVKKLVGHGYLGKVPHSNKLVIMNQPKGDTTMEAVAPVEDAPVVIPVAPRQPTLADNRRIREYLDTNYDEAAGRWCGDLTDLIAADKLRVPRAWVGNIRASLYGEDINEARDKVVEAAEALVAEATRLKDDALTIATRAEELERQARKLLGQG